MLLSVPRTLGEWRISIACVRRGLMHLFGRFADLSGAESSCHQMRLLGRGFRPFAPLRCRLLDDVVKFAIVIVPRDVCMDCLHGPCIWICNREATTLRLKLRMTNEPKVHRPTTTLMRSLNRDSQGGQISPRLNEDNKSQNCAVHSLALEQQTVVQLMHLRSCQV